MNTCVQCGQSHEVTPSDLEFYDLVSPVFDSKKYEIPPPKLCPICRHQRRLAFRNERKLYQRRSDLSGKSIISIYAPDQPFTVYDQEEWWSDKWNPLDHGKDFDFSRSFCDQLRELYEAVPHVSLYNTNTENSYYTNYALNQKNCYLVFGAGNNEDCMFGKFIVQCKDVVDSLAVYLCELCYEGVASERCFNCRYFVNSRGCANSLMIEDCTSCQDLIGCFGLRAKQHCFLNKQYSKEEFEKIRKSFSPLIPEKIRFLKDKMEELKSTLPHIQSHIYASENCTGDSVYNCKNCENAFDCKESEDSKNIAFAPKTIHTQDCIFCAPDGDRYSYNVCSTVGLENSMACFYVWNGNNIYYSIECHHCHNIIGCVGLKNKNYCIFNREYSKEEYHRLAGKIAEHMIGTGEWGEYFPYSLSPFAYNETIAQEYMPITKEEAEKIGAKWRDEEPAPAFKGKEFTPPADIREADESICEKVMKCEATGRKFKIIPQEFKFYKKMDIPIPTLCPDERHFRRLALHNAYRFWERDCAKCGKKMNTVFSPERQEIVYCEECYLKEVY